VLHAIWLLPALPLAGFVIILVAGRRLGDPLAGWLATATVTAAFACSVAAFFELLSRPEDRRTESSVIFTWLPVGGLKVDLGFLADPLSITMALFVTGVGALIHLYGIGYMKGDPKFSKFFLYLNLFVFSMLILVLGSNLVVTFLGWEGVGVCSYFLVSFWQTRPSAATAGKKAFITNRVGDVGFMIAMFLTFHTIGSLNYLNLNAAALSGTLATSTAVAISLLLLLGACGKSAQLPLYLWLPDAMEGPTPVSALIHAATMVTAGIYLLTRVSPLLEQAPSAMKVIAIVGVATAFFAATIAVAQNDIKRVLAYSTVSQLGYMFLAVGSGAYVSAIFLMVAHAFYKALLFLGAGSVIHGVNDEQDMRHMGALRKFMPITAATFVIGWLSIAGVPPFVGFWAKDDDLLYAFNENFVFWLVGLITAFLTAYYMTRQVIMVFYGEARWTEARPEPVAAGQTAESAVGGSDHSGPATEAAAAPGGHGGHGDGHHGEPHESPWLMLIPLVVLSLLCIFGGLINLPFSGWKHLERWLDPVVGGSEHALTSSTEAWKWWLLLIAVVAALAGIVTAYLVYERKRIRAVEPAFLARGWYYDAAVTSFVGGPGEEAFELTAAFDHDIVDGAVNGTGRGIRDAARNLRRLQNGYVRSYALGIGIGAVALLGWFVARGL
jgi:NADH-quinone oxidoreductase subunit L